MKLFVLLPYIVLFGTLIAASRYRKDVEDNEFAEFEDFEEEEDEQIPKEPQDQTSAPKVKKFTQETEYDEVEENVEDEDNEFEHFQDEEEFEFFDSDGIGIGGKLDEKEAPKITITTVPLDVLNNWDSYYLEMLMIAGLIVYALNFFIGKNRNSKLANAWFTTHKTLLEENFSLVGDDEKLENENPGLIKYSENIYIMWCSGRICCEGMLVELKFLKRQELVAVIANVMRPSNDQVHIKVYMSKEHMDNVIMCIATKKTAMHMSKNMADLSLYCPERRSVEKYGLPPNFLLLCEIVKVASSMLDSHVVTAVNKYSELIDYIHFSDRFSGAKQPEHTAMTKLPETIKLLMFGFNIQLKGKPMNEAMEQMRPLLQLVFYCIKKVKRFRLGKVAKHKAEKNRLRVEENFLKTTHAARAEAATARKEKKKREERERILLENDPNKRKKWEDREMKRQMKKKASKMKKLKVKAL